MEKASGYQTWCPIGLPTSLSPVMYCLSGEETADLLYTKRNQDLSTISDHPRISSSSIDSLLEIPIPSYALVSRLLRGLRLISHCRLAVSLMTLILSEIIFNNVGSGKRSSAVKDSVFVSGSSSITRAVLKALTSSRNSGFIGVQIGRMLGLLVRWRMW